VPRDRFSTGKGRIEELPKADPVVGIIRELQSRLQSSEGQIFEYGGETYRVDAGYVLSLPMQDGYKTVLLADLVRQLWGSGRANWQAFWDVIMAVPQTPLEPVMGFEDYCELCKQEGRPINEKTKRWMEKMIRRRREIDEENE
jgi:hypothetical protein